MFDSIIKFLKQPYPDKDDPISILKSAIATALIVFFVLFIFKPGDIGNAGDDLFKYALYFSFVSFLVVLLYDFFVIHVLNKKRDTPHFKFYHWFTQAILLVVCIAIANFALVSYLFDGVHWNNLFNVIFSTFVVAIFPIFIFGTLNLIRNLRANQAIAESIDYNVSFKENINNQTKQVEVLLSIKNSQKTYSIKPENLLFVEAMQNYVSLNYLDAGQLKKETIRTTLSTVLAELNYPPIKQTHRSFLVNCDYIKEISGNAQGLKLILDSTIEFHPPVSRKYISLFR